ncbi:LAMI_0C07096g1_1 [Lachancea mirantina]|uniref:LAMI_0C07096g1_1 n=1 Tax=Lachancea mirantina TaxID=1230905 RepID=A0A1G4J3M5_9SACH|nr:LAMI_0C07096g1_1 [Lachancea mirantina]
MATKRNLRVATFTAILLFLVYLVLQNVATVTTISEQVEPGKHDGKPAGSLAGSLASVPNGQDPQVDSEIEAIRQETGALGTSGGAKGSSPSSGTSGGAMATKPFDVSVEYALILKNSPMIIFSKSMCPFSKRLKDLLAQEFEFTPEYRVVELDKHTHGRELQDYIASKTGRATVPNVIINGQSRGGFDDLDALHARDALLESLRAWSDKTMTITKKEKPSNN